MGTKSINEVLEFQERFIIENGEVDFDEEEPVFVNDMVSEPLVINYAFPEYMGKEIQDISYMDSNGMFVSDISIEELGFSIRTVNGLYRAGYQMINQIAFLKYEELLTVKNLGAKSVAEIIDFFKKNAEVTLVGDVLDSSIEEVYGAIVSQIGKSDETAYKQILKVLRIVLGKNENEIKMLHVGCDTKTLLEKKQFYELIWETSQIRNVYSAYILSNISDSQIVEHISRDNYFVKIGLFDSVVKELIDQKKIEEINDSYRIRRPYIIDWIATIENDNQKQAVVMRLNGKTLEDCGQSLGLTRERVRQIVNKAIARKPVLREDDYKEWFEKYAFDREAFVSIFNETNQVYNYLNMVYKHGIKPVEDMMDEANVSGNLCTAIGAYINRDNIMIGQEYVPCKREILCRKLAELKCSNSDISFDDFYELYMRFLINEGLEKKENLLFPSSRAFTARIEDSSYVLMKYGRRFRYYPVDEVDIEELIQRLRFEQYKDIEISTLKLFKENQELMKEFDIRDEYELHNLLKKTVEKWNIGNKYNISINRMPLLTFGEADRQKQTEDLLFQLAPISIEEFCEFYELEYGVLSRTVMANFTSYISNYYHKGMYSVNQPLFASEELAYMSDYLKDDFYFIEDIKEVYCSRFDEVNINRVNPRTLKELGYRVYTNYIVSVKFANAYEYFKYFLLKDDTIDLKKQDRRLAYIQIVNSTLEELRSSYQLLEYGDMQFIKLSRLQSVYPDISVEMIEEYVDAIIRYSEDEKYFTVKRLKNKGFHHRLHDVGLDEWFNSGLIKNSRKVRFIKTGANVIFYRGDRQITTVDFIRFIMKREKQMDIYDFINMLRDDYGIILSKDKVIQLAKPTTMYYDSIMEKLYLSKDFYYEEI